MRLQLIVLLCLFLIPQLVFATETDSESELFGKFTVTVDDHVNVFIQPAIQENEEVYLPLRSFLSSFGAKITWNKNDNSTTILADEKEYLLPMDLTNLTASIEDSIVTLKMINSRAYIPLSFIKEIMNFDFSWDNESKTLHATRIPDSPTIFRNLPEAPLVPEAPQYQIVKTFTGIASWYGGKFHGRMTNNGEIFDENGFTAAHKTLPFNTYLRVTFLENNESTIVRINDRGPHIPGRILDLSKGAAEEIGLRPHGLGEVKIEILANYEEVEA